MNRREGTAGLCLAFLLCGFGIRGWSQEEPVTWKSIVDPGCEVSVQDDELDFSILEEQREDLRARPVNLGVTDPLSLLRLFSLNGEEADAVYRYILLYGPMKTPYELFFVEGISREKATEILPFVIARPRNEGFPGFSGFFRRPAAEVMITANRLIQEKAGFSVASGDSVPAYPGDPWKIRTKVRFSQGAHLKAGLALQKEAGETFPPGTSPLAFDDRAASLGLLDFGSLETLVLGTYRVSFGQGLTLGTGSSVFRGADPAARFRPCGICPSLTLSPWNRMLGAGASLRLERASIDLLYSRQGRDASPAGVDTGLSVPVITGLPESTLHRTTAEKRKRERVMDEDAGLHLGMGGEIWKSGISLLFHRLHAVMVPGEKAYQALSDTAGRKYFLGFDWLLYAGRVCFFGEACLQAGTCAAVLAGMNAALTDRVSVSFQWLSLPASWDNPHMAAGIRASSEAPEKSARLSCNLLVNRSLDLSLHSRYTRFPWLRYQVSAPSERWSNQVVLTLRPGPATAVSASLRHIRDLSDAHPAFRHTDSLLAADRLSLGIDATMTGTAGDRLDLDARWLCMDGGANAGFGLLVSNTYTSCLISNRFRISFHVVIFNTSSYDSRIYAWDPGIYQSFSMPAYYGKGMQLSSSFQLKTGRRITAWLKLSHTTWNDRVTLGSGSDRIDGSGKTDLSLQLRISTP